jgi:hypothetical protein
MGVQTARINPRYGGLKMPTACASKFKLTRFKALYILGPHGESVGRQTTEIIRKATTFVLAVFLWLHAFLFLDIQLPFFARVSSFAKLTSSETIILTILVAFSLIAASGFWRMVLSGLYIYFFPFVLFWRSLQLFAAILRKTNTWLHAQRGQLDTTLVVAAPTPPAQTTATEKPQPVKKHEPLWQYLLRPFQRFTFLWCLLLLMTSHKPIITVCLVVLCGQIVRKVLFLLRAYSFSDAFWQKYRLVMFSGLEKAINALNAFAPGAEPSAEQKGAVHQLDLWVKILRFLSDPYLVSRWGAIIVGAILGTIYLYFALIFSFLYHGFSYVLGVSYSWEDALVTSVFIPFLITDLPKLALVRMLGGLHCTLIVLIGLGTIVNFFRRKLVDVRKSAEDMSKRLAEQSLREKYFLVRDISRPAQQKPPTPPSTQPKVRRTKRKSSRSSPT